MICGRFDDRSARHPVLGREAMKHKDMMCVICGASDACTCADDLAVTTAAKHWLTTIRPANLNLGRDRARIIAAQERLNRALADANQR